MTLTEHFEIAEFTASDTARREGVVNHPSGTDVANMRALCEKILEPARAKIGMPIIINSGFRCKRLNEMVGGAANSYHLSGKAADVRCADNERLLKVLMELPFAELIAYRHKRTNVLDRIHVAYNGGQRGISFTKYIA